jgi:predicted RNA-binding protein (virulence factor B family)
MNETINLGVINTLQIKRQTDNGYYLEAKNEEEVLLPNAFITEDMKLDDQIDVFIYTDSEDRLVATTQTPFAFKDQFAFLEVVDTLAFGAFVDIGLSKDLLVPRNRQKSKFNVGEKRIIRIIEDEESGRLIGVEKITSYLSKKTKHFKRNDSVKVLIIATTPLGFKVIVDNNYEGMIYKNEVFENLKVGDTKDAFIKTVRGDGKIDISLQAIGNKNKDSGEQKVIDILKENNNFLPLNYKSDPEDIKNTFGLSKKNFKKTLTSLQEKKLIQIEEKGITLL